MPVSPPADRSSGRMVTETLTEYDGGRKVTVYVPPRDTELVVFAGDGQQISRWGRLLETTDAPSTMIVGVHGLSDEMSRLTHRSLIPSDSRPTRDSLLTMSVDGWHLVLTLLWARSAPRCSVTRREES
jgi:hypothetical protein